MFRLLLALPFLLSALVVGQDSASRIIQRSLAANQRDWDAAPAFDCSEQDQKRGGSRTYEDLMVLGSSYERLVAVNGKPLTSAGQSAENRKLDDEIEVRRHESTHKRMQRIAKYEAKRKHDHTLMEQLAKAFDFKLVGEQTLNAHEVYALKAMPRPGYQPPNMESQALMGMQGTLWIDKATFQWVKVQARVMHPVSIEGFLAQVEPGTHFELEKAPVSADIWLPKHFSMRAHAKVLYLFQHNGQEDDTYFNYHEAQATPTEGSANAR
jgi:hypothetical protein